VRTRRFVAVARLTFPSQALIRMAIRPHSVERIIPEYSLTGDLLAFLKCGQQYRLYNKAGLPPSIPVQQWFGEFIHGLMEEAFARWQSGEAPWNAGWPWRWEGQIRPIEEAVFRRLLSRGLRPPPRMLYASYDNPTQEGRGIASLRAEVALNTWGVHLFPLVAEAELRLMGSRELPPRAQLRAGRYSVTGIVDVLSSVQLHRAPASNVILHRLHGSPVIRAEMERNPSPFEIIVDYKGMRRPASGAGSSWIHQEWQLQTYAWLRHRQNPNSRVIAGVLLYLNELVPSATDLRDLRKDVSNGATDIMPGQSDRAILFGEQETAEAEGEEMSVAPTRGLSRLFLEDRSFRIVEITSASLEESAARFDSVVGDIETAVQNEILQGSTRTPWPARPEVRTCTACDFKYHCPDAIGSGRNPQIP